MSSFIKIRRCYFCRNQELSIPSIPHVLRGSCSSCFFGSYATPILPLVIVVLLFVVAAVLYISQATVVLGTRHFFFFSDCDSHQTTLSGQVFAACALNNVLFFSFSDAFIFCTVLHARLSLFFRLASLNEYPPSCSAFSCGRRWSVCAKAVQQQREVDVHRPGSVRHVLDVLRAFLLADVRN